MVDFLQIATSLDSHLSNMSGVPAISWPNDNYSPGSKDTFLRPTHIPIQPITLGFSDDGSAQRVGLYQVDVFVPRDEGTKEGLDIATAIAAHFAKGASTIAGLVVRETNVETGYSGGTFYQIPVLIRYVTITQ